jgi:hypothetical protein
VAILFGQLADQLGFKVVQAQTRVPDLVVIRRGKQIRVELEFSSKGFRREVNNGDWKKCDLVVCWKHDWGAFPAGIPVYELRKIFGIGRSIWVLPMWTEFADNLPKGRSIADRWSVPSTAGADDLLLIYRPKNDPDSNGCGEVRDVMRVRSLVERRKAGWRKGFDWMASIQRVATLDQPLSFDDLTKAGIKPQQLQGRPDVTKLWPKIRKRLPEAIQDQIKL